MRKRKQRLDFEVDRLTNSIQNILTGEVFETEIIQLGMQDKGFLQKLKWSFDWAAELENPRRQVHAVTTKENPLIFQGLVSSEDFHDHVYLHLLESAPLNKGHTKLYAGVPGNLVAFLCKTSFEKGYQGNVVFEPKTRLIEHYEKTLGAQRITRSRMFIGTRAAYRLVTQYFPDFDHDRL